MIKWLKFLITLSSVLIGICIAVIWTPVIFKFSNGWLNFFLTLLVYVSIVLSVASCLMLFYQYVLIPLVDKIAYYNTRSYPVFDGNIVVGTRDSFKRLYKKRQDIHRIRGSVIELLDRPAYMMETGLIYTFIRTQMRAETQRSFIGDDSSKDSSLLIAEHLTFFIHSTNTWPNPNYIQYGFLTTEGRFVEYLLAREFPNELPKWD